MCEGRKIIITKKIDGYVYYFIYTSTRTNKTTDVLLHDMQERMLKEDTLFITYNL